MAIQVHIALTGIQLFCSREYLLFESLLVTITLMQRRLRARNVFDVCPDVRWPKLASKLAHRLSPAVKFNNLNGPTLTPLMVSPKQMQLVHFNKGSL